MRKRKKWRAARLIASLCLLAGAGSIGLGILINEGGGNAVQETIRSIRSKELPFEEVSIEEGTLENRFYYQQLEEKEQIVYREILQGVQENREEIYLHGDNSERANAIFQNVLDDNPEIFWCSGQATSVSYPETFSQEAYVVIKPSYTCEETEKEQRMQEIEAAVQECLNQIPEGADEYGRIRSVYEYLINTVEYDADAEDNQNIYSALAGRASVCAGYARSTQYLLNRQGIFCTYVTGTAENADGETEDHAWNIVKCGGAYYFIDTTWGDPVFQQEEDLVAPRAMTYDYLCCSEDELFQTHTLDEGYEYPSCTSGDLNYYRMNGMYYETYDREQLLQAMLDGIDAGNTDVIFKFADRSVYEEAHDTVIGELIQTAANHLGQKYGLSEVWYSYEEDILLNKITIYWKYE